MLKTHLQFNGLMQSDVTVYKDLKFTYFPSANVGMLIFVTDFWHRRTESLQVV